MRTIAAVAVMLCLASPALADCEPADLKGQWHGFLFGNFQVSLLPFFLGCTAIISGNGRFRSGSRCDDGSALERLQEQSIDLRANFEVHRNCTVRGVITFRSDAAFFVQDCPLRAVVTPNHEMMTGVANCGASAVRSVFDDIMINVVRR
jgi:hypothetical protein